MRVTILTLLAVGSLMLGAADAADTPPITGRSLMTEQERAEHRDRMRNMENQQEREVYREQAHDQMRERAKTEGQTLPEQPRAPGGARFDGRGGRYGAGGGRGR